jgi:hypothetical protein
MENQGTKKLNEKQKAESKELWIKLVVAGHSVEKADRILISFNKRFF